MIAKASKINFKINSLWPTGNRWFEVVCQNRHPRISQVRWTTGLYSMFKLVN